MAALSNVFRLGFATLLASSIPVPVSSQEAAKPEILHFKIVNGETIAIPMTNNGLFTENEAFSITSVGFRLDTTGDENEPTTIHWEFSIRLKSNFQIKNITVEEVAPSKEGQIFISDDAPIFSNNKWVGRCKSFTPSKSSFPELYSAGETVFVFKVSILPLDGKALVLYRPLWLSQPLKLFYLMKLGQLKPGVLPPAA